MKSLKMLGILGLAAISTGCVPDWAQENETGIYMEIAGISPAPFTSEVRGGEDLVLVLVNAYRKNITVSSTGPLEHIRLESYQVRFFRSDGRNVEGLDVPHRTTGALGAGRIHTPTETGELPIEVLVPLVRQTQKLEAPLVNLIGRNILPNINGRIAGEGFISTVAEITIFAKQVTTGEALSASGRVQVTFGDFGDDLL